MTDETELLSKEVDRIDHYREIVRQMYLEALESNGYNEGFDFSTVTIDVSPIPGYAVPRLSGSIQFRRDTMYIPEGVKYEAFFSVSFIERSDGLEIVKREQEHYLSSRIEEVYGSENHEEIKGPYPGSRYFQDELDRIDESLKRHKPTLLLADNTFVELEKPLGAGLEVFVDSEASFYAMTANTVLIYLPIQSTLYQAVTFVYDIETGEISKITRVPPPALA